MHKSIFVSSTFKDFQRERDLLQNKVELRVNELLRHTQVSFLDLRWGIDTTGEKSLHKVVSICIAEVLNSKPFYVIMLGDTYGSCVDEAVARSLYELNGLHYDGQEKSVTQIEIEATGLLEGNNEFVLVLDRRTDCEPDPRAERLKQRVLAAAVPENVFAYTAHSQGGTYVPEDEHKLIEFIARRLQFFLKDHAGREESPALSLAREQAALFCGRQELVDAACEAIRCWRGGPLMRFYAPAGAGLSALFSKLFICLQEEGFEVACLADHSELPMPFTGALFNLAEQYKIQAASNGGFFDALDPEKRYICFLDGLEELAEDPIFRTLIIRQQIPENLLFVLGTNGAQGDFCVGAPSREDALAIFDGTAKAYRKEIPATFREYFREHIPEEMVRQPAFLRQFLSALCYLTEEDYRSLAGTGNFADRLSKLFLAKLEAFPADEQSHIRSLAEDGEDAQLWILGLLAVITGMTEDRMLLGTLRSGGIDAQMLDLRTVKERFRDSVYCPEENSYAISRASFRKAVLRCFTTEQQKWLRYLWVDYMGQNVALHVHPDIFPEIAYQYLILEDYELLARLLEQSCLMPEDGRRNGLRFALLCGDYGRDMPSSHYRALAAQGNPYCNRWLVKYAMPYITDLYRQNGADMFGQMYKTVIADGQDPQNAADLFALQIHGLTLAGYGGKATELTMQELTAKRLTMLPGGIMIGQYLAACTRYDTEGAAAAIDFMLKDIRYDAPGVEEVLSQYLLITVLMDGDATVYRPQLERLFSACEDFLEAKGAPSFAVALPLSYLALRLHVPLRNPETVWAAMNSEDSRMDYALSLQLLLAYMECQAGEDGGAAIGQLLKVVMDRQIPLGTLDLFFASRFFRLTCYMSKYDNSPEAMAECIRILYQRIWDIRGGVWCGMQSTELIYLGCLLSLYAGVDATFALMKDQLADSRLSNRSLLMDLGFFREDAEELIEHLQGQKTVERLEKRFKVRKTQ